MQGAVFFLEVLPEIEAVFIRDDFQVIDNGKLYDVHRADPVDVRMSLGIGYEFPVIDAGRPAECKTEKNLQTIELT